MIQPTKTTSYRKQAVATKTQKTYVAGDESDVSTPKQTNKSTEMPNMYAAGLMSVNYSPK